MKFKQWLQEYGGGSGDFGSGANYGTAMHGGIFGKPGSHLNTGVGGIKSKYQTTSGSEPEETDVDPDELFGIKSSKDKRDSKERKAKNIDKNRRRSRIWVSRPYT